MTPPRLLWSLVVMALLAGIVPAEAQVRHGALFRPEDLTKLESPDRDIWQKPEQIMDSLGIFDGAHVADIGAGGGWFTVRLARRVGPNGLVWAEDVQPEMLEAIRRRVAKDNLRNIRLLQGKEDDPMLPASSLDAVLIVETYQDIEKGGHAEAFLRNVREALKDGGRLGIVDYKREGSGPGPDGPRPDPAAIIEVARKAGLRLMKRETFLPFQFLLVFVR